MKLIHTENYEAMSKEAADLLMDTCLLYTSRCV